VAFHRTFLRGRLLFFRIGCVYIDRKGWPRCATAPPIRAGASTTVIFSLMASREDGYI
jgi:hypothetical protein